MTEIPTCETVHPADYHAEGLAGDVHRGNEDSAETYKNQLNELAARFQYNDDNDAFIELYEALSGKIVNFLIRKGADYQLAEDLTQETFTKVYTNIQTHDGSNFSNWVFKIASNTFASHFRLFRNRNEFPEDASVLSARLDQVGVPDQATARLELIEMLQTIPPKDAYVLWLHYVEGFSYQEIADELGKTLSSIKSRIHAAKERYINHR